MAPWTVYKGAGNKDLSDTYPTVHGGNGGFENPRLINGADHIKTHAKVTMASVIKVATLIAFAATKGNFT